VHFPQDPRMSNVARNRTKAMITTYVSCILLSESWVIRLKESRVWGRRVGQVPLKPRSRMASCQPLSILLAGMLFNRLESQRVFLKPPSRLEFCLA
jgi:hypothetical protein